MTFLSQTHSGQLLLGGDWGSDEGDEEGGISGSQRVLKVCTSEGNERRSVGQANLIQ